MAEDLQFIMQSAFPEVLTGENCICIGTSLIQDHNPRLQPLFWPSFWVLIISADKSEEIQFIYSLLGWLKSLVTVDVLDKQTNHFQKSFGILLGILLSCCCFIFILNLKKGYGRTLKNILAVSKDWLRIDWKCMKIALIA